MSSFQLIPQPRAPCRDWNVEKYALMGFVPDQNLFKIAGKYASSKPLTRAEAIQIILSNIGNAKVLLGMMTKDILWNYLTTIRPPVDKRLLKDTLVDMILQEWGPVPIQPNNCTLVQNFYIDISDDLQKSFAKMFLCDSALKKAITYSA